MFEERGTRTPVAYPGSKPGSNQPHVLMSSTGAPQGDAGGVQGKEIQQAGCPRNIHARGGLVHGRLGPDLAPHRLKLSGVWGLTWHRTA